MILKVCTKCSSSKPTSEFNKNKRRLDGFQSYCRACQKKIDAESYSKSSTRRRNVSEQGKLAKARGKKFVQRYKRIVGCKLCTENEPAALDLHHLDPSVKEGNPSEFYGHSRSTLKSELRKCVVLCANCHRKVHAGLLTI